MCYYRIAIDLVLNFKFKVSVFLANTILKVRVFKIKYL